MFVDDSWEFCQSAAPLRELLISSVLSSLVISLSCMLVDHSICCCFFWFVVRFSWLPRYCSNLLCFLNIKCFCKKIMWLRGIDGAIVCLSLCERIFKFVHPQIKALGNGSHMSARATPISGVNMWQASCLGRYWQSLAVLQANGFGVVGKALGHKIEEI